MNNSRFHRSEEARRNALAVVQEARQRESAALQERAEMFASETKKVEGLRAQRLAREAAGEIEPPRVVPKTRSRRSELAA